MSRAICWLRRDLRLHDHRALHEACMAHDQVAVVFVFDRVILDALTNKRDRRVTFIVESLRELDAKLRARGSQLVVLIGNPVEEIPRLAASLHVQTVVAARDFEPYALQRDAQVDELLQKLGVQFQTVKDQVIFEKGEILSKSHAPFRVFTPYSRRWLEKFDRHGDAADYQPDLSRLMTLEQLVGFSSDLSYGDIGFTKCDPWLEPGEDAGLALLRQFKERIHGYHETRDYPAVPGSSYLSVHLRIGTVSIREAVRSALESDSTGANKWLMELIWRDFYQDILANHPHVATEPFDPKYRELEWRGTDEHFRLWCEGKTGFPIVDAAMRCFNETGWMHNRLRMIVASFLTKDLLVDYRKGEKYFADNLLDFDLASNNGGWQWAASVGCDAQPYFRIFNPILQSSKFDPDGAFIRRWVSELAELDSKSIHCPGPFDLAMTGYSAPIVDHDVQRGRAIAMFSAFRAS